jgi:hypothetical protein
MPNLIKPGSVKVTTQDGEIQVSITLDLNINLDSNGLQISANASQASAEKKKEEEDVSWAIPDFSSFKKGEKVNFGKEKKEEG